MKLTKRILKFIKKYYKDIGFALILFVGILMTIKTGNRIYVFQYGLIGVIFVIINRVIEYQINKTKTK